MASLTAVAPVLVAALLTCFAGCSSDAGDGEPATAGNRAGAGSGSAGSGPVTSGFPDASTYVTAHNAVRAAVQEPAQYSGTWAPLPPVAWSDAVAATAQVWADHLRDSIGCGLQHDSDSDYGENLAAGTNVGAQRAVDMWASEVDRYSYSPRYVFDGETGHYTQIVWRRTTHIGCASAKCASSSVVVCRYDPPGNFGGQQPY